MAKKARVYDGTAWQELASAQTDLTAYSTTAQMNTAIGDANKILQVVSVSKSNAFTTTSATYVDVTDFSASITPSSTSSKVLIFLTIGSVDNSTVGAMAFNVLRDTTAIGGGTDGAFIVVTDNANRSQSPAFSFLDSPATVSSVTYKLQIKTTAGTAYINRRNVLTATYSSSITLMEVAG